MWRRRRRRSSKHGGGEGRLEEHPAHLRTEEDEQSLRLWRRRTSRAYDLGGRHLRLLEKLSPSTDFLCCVEICLV